MNIAVSVSLVVALVVSATPVAVAQEQEEPGKSLALQVPGADPMVRPLARAVPREAARLATTPAQVTTAPAKGVDPSRPPEPSDWSRVRHLPSGTRITLTIRGRPPVHRIVVAGDESVLMVSDVVDPTVGQIERIARADIAEVITEPKSGSQRRREDPSWMIGMVAGMVGGVYIGAKATAATGCDSCVGGILLGAIGGAIGGALLWDYAFIRKADVIYRAP
jgi:hypothetical protein